MAQVLGVDIGGSHITVAAVDLEARRVVPGSGKRKLVNAKAGADEILADWCELINQVAIENKAVQKKVGIAMPGPFNYEEGIALIKDQDKFKALYGVNVKNELAKRLGITSNAIRFMNDASCFLQGEVFGGAAKGANKVLGLTLGTGLGSAICKNGIAEDADLWCAPFKEGIAEDYISTRWFVGRYQELTGRTVSGVKELIETEGSSDVLTTIFSTFSENLAAFLRPQIAVFHPEVVVFGGNISNAFARFQPALQKLLASGGVQVAIKQAVLSEEASLLGAASCWSAASENVRA